MLAAKAYVPTPAIVNKCIAGDSSMVESRVNGQKVADRWFDFRTGKRHCGLGKNTLRLFPIGTKQSTSCGSPA